MKNISQSDFDKIMTYYTDYSKNKNIDKYVKTDPKTGGKYLDEEMINAEVMAEPSSVQITPGGTLAPKTFTKQEAYLAKFMGNIPKIRQDPRIAKAMKPCERRRAKNEKARERDPLIIRDINMEPFDGPLLKSATTIAAAKDYIWGRNDIELITQRLGYEEQEIVSNCQLRLNVFLNTDAQMNIYKMAVFSNAQKMLKFDGEIKSISATPIAVCNKPKKPLPRKGGIFFRVGDKYGINLHEG